MPPSHEIVIKLGDMAQVQEAFEEIALELEQVKEERDFWQNEYEEVLMAIGGKDPRR